MSHFALVHSMQRMRLGTLAWLPSQDANRRAPRGRMRIAVLVLLERLLRKLGGQRRSGGPPDRVIRFACRWRRPLMSTFIRTATRSLLTCTAAPR